MYRVSLLAIVMGLMFAAHAAAQESTLPPPPKPPKSKAKAQEGAPEKEAPRTDESPSDVEPRSDRERGRLFDGEIPRPRRIRIDAPFFHMDLDLGSRRHDGYERRSMPAESRRVEEVVPAPRADEAPAPRAAGGDDWRYRWHEGRWWYWLPSERWVYWEDGRWVDYDAPRGLGMRDIRRLRQSGEIRIGEPRRGNVGLEFEGLPPVNIGF